MTISEKWKETVNNGISNAQWDEYDPQIRQIINKYNNHFKLDVNWLIVKAMLWIENGGPTNSARKTRPMQIGSPDPAYRVLKEGKEGSSEIMVVDPSLQKALKEGKINAPDVNIRAGIAYLFKSMAKFEEKSVRDEKDFKMHEYTVRGGDNLWSIAKHRGTTLEELRDNNQKGATTNIHAGQVLKYRKAKLKLVIISWRDFKDTSEIARNYNGGGDLLYAQKLDYILKDLFPKLKR